MSPGGPAWRISFVGVLFASSAVVLALFVWSPGFSSYQSSRYERQIESRLTRPFVHRTLVPLGVRTIRAALPSNSRAWMRDLVDTHDLLRRLFRRLRWKKDYALEHAIGLVLMFAALMGFGAAMRSFARSVFPGMGRLAEILSVGAVLTLPLLFSYSTFVYDLPVACLFTWGLALMHRRRWAAFLVVYLLACLNKETTILLTLVFVIHFANRARMDRGRFVRLLVAQGVIFAMVLSGLHLAFANRPGNFLKLRLFTHNVEVLTTWSPRVLAWIGLTFLIAWRWSDKPLFLRHALWVLVPLVILALLFGYVDERRDYYEALAVILLMVTHAIAGAFGLDLAKRPVPRFDARLEDLQRGNIV